MLATSTNTFADVNHSLNTRNVSMKKSISYRVDYDKII